MVRLKIINKENYLYDLRDEKENNYQFNLEFFDIDQPPEVGDYISFSEKLLNPSYPGYSTNYTFGNLDSKYGKKDIMPTDIDVIKIETLEKEISLKRLYG